MGGNLPKDLINAERTKLIIVNGVYLRQSFDFENFRSIEAEDEWEKVTISIFKAQLTCTHNEEVEIHPINCDFLIIHQDHRRNECVIGLMTEKKIWKIQAPSIRQFLDFTTALIQSKIPSWTISPVCQICSKIFNLMRRRHHCRNCGKNICKKCTISERFVIEGFYRLKKVCRDCILLIKSQIGTIQDIQRNEIVREGSSRSLMLPCPTRLV